MRKTPSKTKIQQQQRWPSVLNSPVFLVAVLGVLGGIAYLNSFDVPFIFDDLDSVRLNRDVLFRNYSIFHPQTYLFTRSLLYLTFQFNYWLGGEYVLGFHIVNVLLHIFNGLLVFVMCGKILKTAGIDADRARVYSFLSASFFLLHPIQTESVTYISSRSELLSTFFYLTGFLVFIKFPENKIGLLASVPITILILLGLGAKETVVTLPAMIFLYDYLFIAKTEFSRIWPRWRFYLLFVVLGTYSVYYLLTARVAAGLGTYASRQNYPWWNYLISQPPVIARYLRLLVVPTGFNLDYDFPVYSSVMEPAIWLSLLLICILVFAAWRWRRTKPVFTFSIFWFFIALSPTSSVVPIPDVIFEHRVYLPLAGACLAFPFVVEWLIALPKKQFEIRRIVGSSIAVLVVLAALTILRNEVWRNDARLWSDVISKSPHKLRPYNALIYTYMQRGENDKAISIANLGAENVPAARLSFLDTVGNLYLKMGRPDQAVGYFKSSTDEAVRAGLPESKRAGYFNNLGVAYMALAQTVDGPDRAQAWRRGQEAFRTSLQGNDKNVSTLDSFVNVTYMLGDGPALQKELTERLRAAPKEFRTLYSLGALLSLETRYAESLEYFDRAERVFDDGDPGEETLFFSHALALTKAQQVEKAIEKYRRALFVNRFFDEAHYNLALLYIGKQDYDSAVQHLNDVLTRVPAHPRANMTLARIYAFQRKWTPARERLQQVLRADPQNMQALALIQQIPVQ